MDLKNILYPTDLSRDNDPALTYASVLAAESGATLHILHADDLQDVGADALEFGYASGAPWDQNERVKVREKLGEIRPPIGRVAYEHHYVRGAPVREIVKFARARKVDLVVMASHGRTGLARVVMGSVAEGVMRKAHCAVLIVKQPTGEASRATGGATRPTSFASSD